MADNKKICEAEENPSELQEPPQQMSLSQHTSQSQKSTSEQSPDRSPASISQQNTPKSSPTFNPELLTAEEQIAYLTHKYSSTIYADADAIPSQPQLPRRLRKLLPLLKTPDRRKLHFKHLYSQPASPEKCRLQSSLSPLQHTLPPSWQAVQQYSLQMPPESRIDDFSLQKLQEWLSILRKHEKKQDEKNQKKQDENIKTEQ